MASDYDAPRRNDDEPGADPMEADGAEPRTSLREQPEQPRMAQVIPIPVRPGKASKTPSQGRQRRSVPTWDEIVFGARPESE